MPSPRQEKCHQYWPAERSARYQYFVVDPMAEYNMPQYILREFKVTDARVSAGLGWRPGLEPRLSSVFPCGLETASQLGVEAKARDRNKHGDGGVGRRKRADPLLLPSGWKRTVSPFEHVGPTH